MSAKYNHDPSKRPNLFRRAASRTTYLGGRAAEQALTFTSIEDVARKNAAESKEKQSTPDKLKTPRQSKQDLTRRYPMGVTRAFWERFLGPDAYPDVAPYKKPEKGTVGAIEYIGHTVLGALGTALGKGLEGPADTRRDDTRIPSALSDEAIIERSWQLPEVTPPHEQQGPQQPPKPQA